jgi:aminoglycoside phosphotransferase (APT) family kinase protein
MKYSVKDNINIAALEKWLNDQFLKKNDLKIINIKAPSSGFSALTVVIDVEDQSATEKLINKYAVRLEKSESHVFLDADINRQGQMMSALRKHGIPVPEIIGCEASAVELGGKFLVMEYFNAHALPQAPNYLQAGLLTTLKPEARHSLISDALTQMTRINKLEWQADFAFLDKPDFGPPGLNQYLKWIQAWRNEAMDGKPNQVLDTAIDWLLSEQPDNPHIDVLWGDSNLGNYLFNDNGTVAAVIDFEAAALGPAEIDIGWWFFVDDMLTQGADKLEGMPNREEQLAIYTNVLGRKVIALQYFEILAALRMSLVIARTTLLLIRAGRLPPENKAAYENIAISILAKKLGLAEVKVAADYMAFAAALSER